MQEAEHPGGGPPPNRPVGTVTDEDLGTQTMFGVTVSGVRNTTTWPSGSYQNNDITVASTDEEWTSRQYGNFVSKRADPQRESSTTMTSFSPAERDPSLFPIPAGYQIVDETAPFTITMHYGSK